MNRVKTPADIPEGPHFAVLVYKSNSVHVPGDERSQTNPGHGYPAHTVTTSTFEQWVTCDEAKLQAKVAELSAVQRSGQKQPVFVVLKVERKLTVSTQTTVSIGQ